MHETCEEPERIGNSSKPWAVERMVYRQKGPYCKERDHKPAFDPNVCKQATGRRKYAIHPGTMSGFLTPHAMLVMKGFDQGFYDGVHITKKMVMSASDIVLAHYIHYISKPFCSLDMATFLTTEGAIYEYPDKSPFNSFIWVEDLGVRKTVEYRRRKLVFF